MNNLSCVPPLLQAALAAREHHEVVDQAGDAVDLADHELGGAARLGVVGTGADDLRSAPTRPHPRRPLRCGSPGRGATGRVPR